MVKHVAPLCDAQSFARLHAGDPIGEDIEIFCDMVERQFQRWFARLNQAWHDWHLKVKAS
jgi:hypothetical protein